MPHVMIKPPDPPGDTSGHAHWDPEVRRASTREERLRSWAVAHGLDELAYGEREEAPVVRTAYDDPAPEPAPEPAAPKRRIRKVTVNVPDRYRTTPPGAEPPAPIVTRSRGVELAKELRRRGVDSARWVKRPLTDGAERWELSVHEDDERRASTILGELAREGRR